MPQISQIGVEADHSLHYQICYKPQNSHYSVCKRFPSHDIALQHCSHPFNQQNLSYHTDILSEKQGFHLSFHIELRLIEFQDNDNQV